MKVVNFVSVVDEQKCNGDKRCDNLCPTGAIKVVEKKAKVDPDRCVACGKCEDVCREDAVKLMYREKPMTILLLPRAMGSSLAQGSPFISQNGTAGRAPLTACNR